MSEIPIRMPINGLSENLAFSDQEPATTREARNVRSQNPNTGRIQIAQRAGLSKFNANLINGSNKIADMASIVYDSRNTTYSQVGATSANTTWSKALASAADCPAVATDRQGNCFAIDGNSSIVKYSSDGTLLFTIALPTKDKTDVVRALFVDDIDDVYAAVSDGSRQRFGRMWKYAQKPDDKFEVVWEHELDAFVTKMVVLVDKLYTAQNEPNTKSSFVRVYEALDQAEPELTQEILCGYPLNGIAVKEDGSIIVCSQEDTEADNTANAVSYQRGANPKFPQSVPVLQDWTPDDLADADKRIWSWYKSEDIETGDVYGAFEDGVEVRRWPDSSGNGRHLYSRITGTSGPALRERGHAIWPSVSFDGSQWLQSLGNSSISKSLADQQKSLVPTYTEALYCIFLVIRPDDSVASPANFLDHDMGGSQNTNLDINVDDGAVPTAGTLTFLCDTDGTYGGGPSKSAVPLDASFTHPSGTVIVTLQIDNGVDGGVSNQGEAFTRGLLRVNGTPIDRFENDPVTSLTGTFIGNDSAGGADEYFGDILEMIVIDRRDRLDDTEPKATIEEDGGGKVLSHEGFGDDPGGDDKAEGVQTDNEMTRIEGYLAHKHGVAHLLPNTAGASYEHPFGETSGTLGYGIGPPADGASSAYEKLATTAPYVAKFSTRGDLVWAVNGVDSAEQQTSAGSKNISGIGLDVAVNSEGDIYSIGPYYPDNTPNGAVNVVKLVDAGDTVSADVAQGAWGSDFGSSTLGFLYPRLAVDEHDNVYVPENTGSDTGSLRVYKKDGTLLLDYTLPSSLEGLAVVPLPNIPDYDGDLTNPIAESVFLASENGGTATNATLYKLELVESAPATGSPRTMVNIAVSNGDIKTFLDTGTPATPTGGTAAINTTAPYVQSVAHFGKVYITDGAGSIQVFDPRDDAVTALAATDGGGVAPTKIKIVESWRGRLVVCRGVGLIDEAYNWKMSKIDVPENWDEFPPVETADQAIGGDNAIGPGKVSDIVNGFVPYSDDLAYFLCDHSIYQLTGDPMDGGQLDLVSDVTGGAFGRAWAKDPEGNLYFFGSRGGLYVMRPGALPERISVNRVERRLQAVDLSTHYIRMAWNYRDEGLHIMQMPYGTPSSALLKHWFYDTKTQAIWEDTWGTSASTSVQPTSLLVVDGDDVDDRLLLLGNEDGYVRKWDKSKRDDDSVAIDSYITMGPLAGPDPLVETRFVGPHAILSNDLHGARYELFASNEPESMGQVLRSGDLSPGTNGKVRNRVRGLFSFLRLRNNSVGQAFAVESLSMDVYPAGQKRRREVSR